MEIFKVHYTLHVARKRYTAIKTSAYLEWTFRRDSGTLCCYFIRWSARTYQLLSPHRSMHGAPKPRVLSEKRPRPVCALSPTRFSPLRTKPVERKLNGRKRKRRWRTSGRIERSVQQQQQQKQGHRRRLTAEWKVGPHRVRMYVMCVRMYVCMYKHVVVVVAVAVCGLWLLCWRRPTDRRLRFSPCVVYLLVVHKGKRGFLARGA